MWETLSGIPLHHNSRLDHSALRTFSGLGIVLFVDVLPWRVPSEQRVNEQVFAVVYLIW